jgi:hypothetical protein
MAYLLISLKPCATRGCRHEIDCGFFSFLLFEHVIFATATKKVLEIRKAAYYICGSSFKTTYQERQREMAL